MTALSESGLYTLILRFKNNIRTPLTHGHRFSDLHPQTKLIQESDVYRLIIGSELPTTEEFEEWVMEEVLPVIRKTGGVYMTEQKTEELLAAPDFIIGLAMQVKQIKAERDKAIREKAWVTKGREGTLFSKVGTDYLPSSSVNTPCKHRNSRIAKSFFIIRCL